MVRQTTGFHALYVEQTLTDTKILNKLTNKQIDAIYEAVRKRIGAGKGDPNPVLAVERLKLAVFCLKLAVRTSRIVPEWYEVKRCHIEAITDQKTMEEDYLSSKDPGPKIKPMSLDVHSAPTCFDKIRVILSAMRGCTGIPLSYVIRLRLSPQRSVDEEPLGNANSPFGSIDEELVVRAPILQWEGVRIIVHMKCVECVVGSNMGDCVLVKTPSFRVTVPVVPEVTQFLEGLCV